MGNQPGYLITLEGIEGAGKSTHQLFIRDCLVNAGKTVCTTREPGGTALGEKLRDILLQKNAVAISGESELLMMFAARQQHIQEVIRPALAEGKVVVCDRFVDSSYAYQCGGRGIPVKKFDQLQKWVLEDLCPDMTLLFDLSAETGLQRARVTGEADRFETETPGFFQKVRDAYLEIAETDNGRFHVLDAERAITVIQADIKQLLEQAGLC